MFFRLKTEASILASTNIEQHLEAVEQIFQKILPTDIPLLKKVQDYIFTQKGKRFRPILVLLTAHAFQKKMDKHQVRFPQNTYSIAAILEIIHTASLLHDDVVDQAEIRRKTPTVNALFGNEASILVGDYLLSLSLTLLTHLEDLEMVKIVLFALQEMSKGEITQMETDFEKTKMEDYYQIVRRKTACLMAVAVQLGGRSMQIASDLEPKLYSIGEAIGMAFQIGDDVLDYDLKNEQSGKKHGTDFRERKITLPLLHLYEQASVKRKQELRFLFQKPPEEHELKKVYEWMQEANSLPFALQKAEFFLQKAKAEMLNFGPAADFGALVSVCAFLLDRKN